MYDKNYLRLLIGVALIAFGFLIFNNGLQFKTFISSASFAISFTLIFHLLFSNWFWKCKYFKPLLVKVPNLNGTWEGVLKSSWIDPESKQPLSPIKIKAFIRQSFYTISIEVHTDKMVSTSYIAGFVTNPDTGTQDLCYTYTSKSKVETRESNPWHDGTARLSIFEDSFIRLEGEYWTFRKTVGTINLNRSALTINRI